MSIFDELRESLLRGLHPADARRLGDYFRDVLDDFEAAHPGLADLSGTLAGCVLCGAVSHYCVVQSRIVLLGVVCPACAKEAE